VVLTGPLSSNNFEQVIYTHGAPASPAFHPSRVGKWVKWCNVRNQTCDPESLVWDPTTMPPIHASHTTPATGIYTMQRFEKLIQNQTQRDKLTLMRAPTVDVSACSCFFTFFSVTAFCFCSSSLSLLLAAAASSALRLSTAAWFTCWRSSFAISAKCLRSYISNHRTVLMLQWRSLMLSVGWDPAYPKDWSLSGRSGCLNKKQK